jgi:hypothetical protein
MPLRDHFRSPVNDKHRWDSVHGLWPGEIVRQMFDLLPAGFQAEPRIHLGSPFEVDISTYENDSRDRAMVSDGSDGNVATLAVLAPTLTVEAELSEQDQYEILIYDVERGRQLVAAIEIVSPSNKDRPGSRELFISKVASLLQQDVCVSIVDLVTIRQSNLYVELLALLGRSDPQLASIAPHMYAVTLRSRKRPKRSSLLDAWFYPMTVGQPLPTIPIWLTPELRVMLPLDPSYEETCRLLRIA